VSSLIIDSGDGRLTVCGAGETFGVAAGGLTGEVGLVLLIMYGHSR